MGLSGKVRGLMRPDAPIRTKPNAADRTEPLSMYVFMYLCPTDCQGLPRYASLMFRFAQGSVRVASRSGQGRDLFGSDQGRNLFLSLQSGG